MRLDLVKFDVFNNYTYDTRVVGYI